MMLLIPVADASTSPNYLIEAWSFNSYGVVITNSIQVPSVGTAFAVRNGSATYVHVGGGYRLLIPPNDVSGYLIVAGNYPVYMASTNTSSWITSGSPIIMSSYYSLSSSPNYIDRLLEPFTGIVYIPAHTETLYLYVGQTFDREVSSNSTAYGAMRTSYAIDYFIPDTGGADYSALLQTINASIQSVYQALLANGQTESAISDKLVEMANTLQSVLSALQSSGGDVSSIVSALDDVNTKLQSTLDQITSSVSDNDYTQQILDDMDQLMEKIDDLTQQIEDNTNRPPPEDIVPSIPPQLLPPTDETAIAGRNAISGILSSPFFVTFLLMVFSLAFLRYVLFGKSK